MRKKFTTKAAVAAMVAAMSMSTIVSGTAMTAFAEPTAPEQETPEAEAPETETPEAEEPEADPEQEAEKPEAEDPKAEEPEAEDPEKEEPEAEDSEEEDPEEEDPDADAEDPEEEEPEEEPVVRTKTMFRLYNPNSGEHFYTASKVEVRNCIDHGWSYEGIGWIAPVVSDTPVYRLYNKNAGDHHYTKSRGERNALLKLGWKDEGIGWYSADDQEIPVYRQYNPNAKAGSHNYTIYSSENDYLAERGWKEEGIGWYGMDPDDADTPKLHADTVEELYQQVKDHIKAEDAGFRFAYHWSNTPFDQYRCMYFDIDKDGIEELLVSDYSALNVGDTVPTDIYTAVKAKDGHYELKCYARNIMITLFASDEDGNLYTVSPTFYGNPSFDRTLKVRKYAMLFEMTVEDGELDYEVIREHVNGDLSKYIENYRALEWENL